MSTYSPLLAQLRHAVKLAEQIESLQSELASVMHSGFAAASSPKGFKQAPTLAAPAAKSNRVSPEGRAKIAEAQKRRWAKWRQA